MLRNAWENSAKNLPAKTINVKIFPPQLLGLSEVKSGTKGGRIDPSSQKRRWKCLDMEDGRCWLPKTMKFYPDEGWLVSRVSLFLLGILQRLIKIPGHLDSFQTFTLSETTNIWLNILRIGPKGKKCWMEFVSFLRGFLHFQGTSDSPKERRCCGVWQPRHKNTRYL